MHRCDASSAQYCVQQTHCNFLTVQILSFNLSVNWKPDQSHCIILLGHLVQTKKWWSMCECACDRQTMPWYNIEAVRQYSTQICLHRCMHTTHIRWMPSATTKCKLFVCSFIIIIAYRSKDAFGVLSARIYSRYKTGPSSVFILIRRSMQEQQRNRDRERKKRETERWSLVYVCIHICIHMWRMVSLETVVRVP